MRVLTPNINLIHLHGHQNEPNSSAADIKHPCWHLRWLPGFNQSAERHLRYRARRISTRPMCHLQPWEGVGLTTPPPPAVWTPAGQRTGGLLLSCKASPVLGNHLGTSQGAEETSREGLWLEGCSPTAFCSWHLSRGLHRYRPPLSSYFFYSLISEQKFRLLLTALL